MKAEGQERGDESVFRLVEDAVTNAVSSMVQPDVKGMFVHHSDDWEEILQVATAGACRVGSERVLKEIARAGCSDIEIGVLISTRSDSLNGYTLKEDWVWHSYYLIKDKYGFWYAGSPGNYRRGEVEESRLTRIIVDDDLNEVMETIENLEGGRWPDGEIIMDKLKREGRLPRILVDKEGKEKLRFAEIYYQDEEIWREDYEDEVD